MTNTAIETPTQPTSKPEADPDDRSQMRSDDEDILRQIEEAIGEIDREADKIGDLALELCDLDLPEEAAALADDLWCLDLTGDFEHSVRRLRNALAAAGEDAS